MIQANSDSESHSHPESNDKDSKLFYYSQERTAIRLAVFCGPWGLDQFYAGHTYLGYLKLFTLGGMGIWWVVDVIIWTTGGVYTTRGCLAISA